MLDNEVNVIVILEEDLNEMLVSSYYEEGTKIYFEVKIIIQ